MATPSPTCLISALEAKEMGSDLDGHASDHGHQQKVSLRISSCIVIPQKGKLALLSFVFLCLVYITPGRQKHAN